MSILRAIVLLLFWLAPSSFFSQSIDSLMALLSKTKGDDKVKCLIRLGDKYLSINHDSSIRYSTLAVNLSAKGKFTGLEAMALNNLGSIYLIKSEYSSALDYFIRAEKSYEASNDPGGRVLTALNIGNVYEFQGLDKKALSQYTFVIALAKEANDRELEAQARGRLGSLEYSRGKKEAAMEHFTEALHINKEINDVPRIMECLNNIAVIYQEIGKYDEALTNFKIDLNYARKMNYKTDVIAALHNIGLVYKDKKEYPKAIVYIDSSLTLASEARDFNALKEGNATLYEVYSEKKDLPNALKSFQLSTAAKDSMLAQDRDREFAEMSTKYETEKKEKENIALKSKHEQDLAVAAEKEKKLNVITYAITIGLIVVILFSFVLSSRLKITRQQKRIIEAQKHVVDEKQKEILDSIHYAQRIQNAILAKEEDIKKQLPLSFLFYQPKDIVAGDFYFFDSTDKYIFYAAADCTGHGVPGALVSVVCSNALSRCVKEFDLHDPGKILDKATELVLETFKKSGQDVKDGMDISFLVKDVETNKFHWSGANNPLWIIRNNNGAPLLEEITANKQPIGLHENPTPFTTHDFSLGKGDSVYLFTDGMPDQFGGPKGKKYKYKRLQEKLMASALLPVDEQKKIVSTDLKEWMGTNEQVDDILLIGFRS
jgi:serine phosphatase RsbU (regulator of sigma subunit)